VLDEAKAQIEKDNHDNLMEWRSLSWESLLETDQAALVLLWLELLVFSDC
jgi:hypothetical protein